MLLKIFIGLVVAVGIFLIVAAFQPAGYRVMRSTTIAAPASKVFAQINDLHNFQLWSPWGKLDPAMKTTYEGPAAGPGASYVWSGNSKVGEGRMTIMESRPNELVRMKLEFLRPFADTSTTDFALKTEGDQTAVTWTMYGEKKFLSKAMCLIMSMDKMVGGDFEKGLAQMKALSESRVAASR